MSILTNCFESSIYSVPFKADFPWLWPLCCRKNHMMRRKLVDIFEYSLVFIVLVGAIMTCSYENCYQTKLNQMTLTSIKFVNWIMSVNWLILRLKQRVFIPETQSEAWFTDRFYFSDSIVMVWHVSILFF